MKRYTMSHAAALEHTPAHPERTARKSGTGLDFDITFQVWNTRSAMAYTIRLQERSEPRPDHWHACQPLRETEGY